MNEAPERSIFTFCSSKVHGWIPDLPSPTVNELRDREEGEEEEEKEVEEGKKEVGREGVREEGSCLTLKRLDLQGSENLEGIVSRVLILFLVVNKALREDY